MEVVIQSGEDDVDMDFALQSLLGTSNVTCLVSEGILCGKVIERRSTANEIRAKLKQSFKSSYGQRFEIFFNNPRLESRFRKMGKIAFFELMSYFVREALYLESSELSAKAKIVLSELEEVEDSLTERLRAPLTEMHRITTSHGYEVKLRAKSSAGDINIITLNHLTAANITGTRIEQIQQEMEVAITRFNSRTGNGRLVVKGHEQGDTIAFGFTTMLRFVIPQEKKAISENLHVNNGVPSDSLQFLTIKVNRIISANGDIVKYLIIRVV